MEKIKCGNIRKLFVVLYSRTYLLSESSNFLRLGSLGNPFNDVRPTLIKLSDSNAVYSSVSPTILVLLQLSKLSSVICELNYQLNILLFKINDIRRIYKQT